MAPKRYDRRVVEITIGKGHDGVGRKRWAIREYGPCGCPDCDKDGHWMYTSPGWFNTEQEARSKL